MASRSHTHLSLIEAVETLSQIADLDFDQDIGIVQKHEVFLDNQPINYKTVHWLHNKDATATISLVKETFRVILHYLRQFYISDYQAIVNTETADEIRTIMVLVGEAAKKLDRYTALFHQAQENSITESKEYRQLQEFYFSKIARKIEEGALSGWIQSLEINKKPIKLRALVKTEAMPPTKRVFIDLETVKKDTEYELFFIRKEDGSRFFSPRLLRNIKLVCDFGKYFGEHQGVDPLAHLDQWYDRAVHTYARQIIKALGFKLEHFFHDLYPIKHHELIDFLGKALIALMMSSHAQNLLRHHPIKNCAEYFSDFQLFLRQALETKTYQKWMAYPPKETNHLALDLLDLIYTICRALYVNTQGINDLNANIQTLISEAASGLKESQRVQSKLWSDVLTDQYKELTRLLKRHPNGPLLRILNNLEKHDLNAFDPVIQHNLPNHLFDLYMGDQRISCLRIPAPVIQDFIQKAIINEEFKCFLKDYYIQDKKHLIINLQDRTSWREYARCVALEELPAQGFDRSLSVVTLATDTDFYHQLPPYNQLNHAQPFIQQLKEHVLGEGAGFYFPSSIDRQELAEFIDQATQAIHRIFFSNKNVLLREHRLDFIQIFYLFLELKLIDWINPSSFSLTCKDTLDTGEGFNAALFAFFILLNAQEKTEQEIDYLNQILYAPVLLVRERLMLPERFNRFVSVLRTIENARNEFGAEHFESVVYEAFVLLFKMPLLHGKVFIPR